MNTQTGDKPGGELSQERQALLALRRMRAKLEELEQARREPIAIIGIGCRFPGEVEDPEAFWHLMKTGRDAVTEVPPDRWDVDAFFDPDPEATGKMNSRWGGFLRHLDAFDPQFFGIAPREAPGIDPQQRLVLEVAWEALEDAGQRPDALTGSATGVFLGICNIDYVRIQTKLGDRLAADAYTASGAANCIASGRLSYVLGLQGPSISVDTACSSSLVAVHLACQSLRHDECRMALAGGVNVILTPDWAINLSRARMLSPTGRCRTFDAAADGFVRSEGCGLVVLKRMSDALADGDRILAVIRGTAINQDGRSSGLTAPNELAQEAVVRAALANAGVVPAAVSYVEAHGTGTILGDPIEVHALVAALGEGRKANAPLVIGSVKTNIGHTEAAAGIAGLIKVVLALQHETIPSHLHLNELNPNITLGHVPVVVPTSNRSWPRSAEPRIAGVSSFGFSGTNVHLIVGEAPAQECVSPDHERTHHILCLSARSETALRRLADRYTTRLAIATDALADVCFTANVGRAHFAYRAAIVVDSLVTCRERLAALSAGSRAAGLLCGHVRAGTRPKVAFLFSGQGSQYARMGQQLYETSSVFRVNLDRCAELLKPCLDRPLLEVLFTDGSAVGQTGYTQPALFALEYALAETWQAWGIRPSAVLGHSVGEYVAACVAGAVPLTDVRLPTGRYAGRSHAGFARGRVHGRGGCA